MSISAKEIIDLPEWRVLSQPIFGGSQTTVNAAGEWIAEDYRNNDYAHPINYFLGTAANLYGYNIKNDAWGQFQTAFGLGGTFGTGATAVFSPSMSPSGTLTTGNSTTKIVLSTALPASVGVNQLANRGDGKGFIVRVIGKSAGGSGKTEERRCIANTSGTTPTIILESPLSFTPASGDGYEFLSGSFLVLGTGALAAAQWRRYDCLTASLSSLVTTNLISTVPASGNNLIAMDEGHVPSSRLAGEGMLIGASTYGSSATLGAAGAAYGALGCLLATGSAAGTLTGQASAGDAAILANQYRNYQIRIVEDTAIPTSVGQRRRITSHTAGASPVYTLTSNWTVTPSTTCKYVIENWSDNIIGLMGGNTNVYNYSISGNTWDTTTWAVKGNTNQSTGSFAFHAFGIVADEINSAKASNIFLFRGATTTFDLFDVAGAATGSWTQSLAIVDWTGGTFDTIVAPDSSLMSYNPHTQGGRFMYFFPGLSVSTGVNQRSAARFDATSFRIEKIAGMKMISGTSAHTQGNFSWVSVSQDASTKVAFYVSARPLSIGVDFWQLMLIR
jgi:hypothetical protein